MAQVDQGVRENVYPQATNPLLRTLSQIAISAVTPIAAVLVALAFGALLLWLNGFNGSDVVTVMIFGSFQDMRSFGEILLKATPLILIGAADSVSTIGSGSPETANRLQYGACVCTTARASGRAR